MGPLAEFKGIDQAEEASQKIRWLDEGDTKKLVTNKSDDDLINKDTVGPVDVH